MYWFLMPSWSVVEGMTFEGPLNFHPVRRWSVLRDG